MMFKKRSQVALEFLLVISILLTIFIVFRIFILKETSDLTHEREYNVVKDMAYMIQTELNLAITLEDGYLRTFKLPETVDGINYTVSIVDEYLVVSSRHQEFLVNIPQITGTINKGNVTINKTEGTIYVT